VQRRWREENSSSLGGMLLPVEATAWSDRQNPIESRGIDGGYLFNLLDQVRILTYRRSRLHRANKRLPSPEMDMPFNARNFVRGHVLEWTAEVSAPLLARVPEEHRGFPKTFLSYTWDADLFESGRGLIDTIQPYLMKDGECVWMDVFCHNQHDVGSVADQMETVISQVDRVLLPISRQPWYDRAWCIWEALCAQKHRKRIEFVWGEKYEGGAEVNELERKAFVSEYRGIAASGATFEEDKELIVNLAVQMHGSVDGADASLRDLMETRYSQLQERRAREFFPRQYYGEYYSR
jgi:hypothetical protein